MKLSMLMSAMRFLPISNLTSRKPGKQRGNHIYILEINGCETLLATFIFLKIYILHIYYIYRSMVEVIVLQNLVIFWNFPFHKQVLVISVMNFDNFVFAEA